MTDKEISKLKRSELVEILAALRAEYDKLESENKSLKEQLAEREDSLFSMVRRLYEDRFGEIKEQTHEDGSGESESESGDGDE